CDCCCPPPQLSADLHPDGPSPAPGAPAAAGSPGCQRCGAWRHAPPAQLLLTAQLMLPFQALFIRVVPYQCLGCVWSQRDKKENMSPTIRATVAQFNAVTNRVIMSLLSPPADGTCSSGPLPTTPAQRACIVEKWIKVAQECRRLKNFSSLKAILSALHSNAVHRLRKTWAAVCRWDISVSRDESSCLLRKDEPSPKLWDIRFPGPSSYLEPAGCG
uniref:Ras-GEF domain-containing protein n=1 Tax=Nothobranchius furzeri TaxID=105023 RepID=A0A8C6LF18_NOTFU